jgi:hypothetical protein
MNALDKLIDYLQFDREPTSFDQVMVYKGQDLLTTLRTLEFNYNAFVTRTSDKWDGQVYKELAHFIGKNYPEYGLLETYCKTKSFLLSIHDELQSRMGRIPLFDTLQLLVDTDITLGISIWEMELLKEYATLLLATAQLDLLQTALSTHQLKQTLKQVKSLSGTSKLPLIEFYRQMIDHAITVAHLFQRSTNQMTKLVVPIIQPILTAVLLVTSRSQVTLFSLPGRPYQLGTQQAIQLPIGIDSYQYLAASTKQDPQTVIQFELPTILSILHLQETPSEQANLKKSSTTPNLANQGKLPNQAKGRASFFSALGFGPSKTKELVSEQKPIKPTKTIVYYDSKLDKTYILHPIDMFPTKSSYLHRLLGVTITHSKITNAEKKEMSVFWEKYEQSIV